MNVDGSCCLTTGDIRAGGVLRSRQGLFLGGFSDYLGKGDILLAELIGIYRGLAEAVSMNVSDIIIESDSSMAIELISSLAVQLHPYSHLIEDCQKLSKCFKSCVFTHIFREANQVADKLVNFSSNFLAWASFVDPPTCISLLLDLDLKGLHHPRLV